MSDNQYDNYSGSGGSLPGGGVMPQDLAAEKSILSAMLLSQEVLQECLVALNEDDFYLYSHKAIFRAMNELFDRGQVVDPVSLADHLRSTGNLDKVGGMAYILDLNTNSFSLASWQHHVEILHRDATLRAIIDASSKITALAFDAPEDTKEVVDTAENLLLGVTNREIGDSYSTLTEVMGDLYTELGEMCQNPDGTLGVSTGYPGIDACLQGLRPGQMVVIGARPGVGKTSFALNLAVNAAAAGASVAFFSLEMSKTEIAQRLLSAQAKIPLSAIRGAKIKDDQWGTILDATRDLSQLDILIDDRPDMNVTEFIIAKNRSGPLNIVPLMFLPGSTKFVEVDTRHGD